MNNEVELPLYAALEKGSQVRIGTTSLQDAFHFEKLVTDLNTYLVSDKFTMLPITHFILKNTSRTHNTGEPWLKQ